MLTGLEKYKASKRVSEGYIMNPTTWLNGGHYYDELEPAARKPCDKSVSRMDDTTRAEMARAAAIKNGKQRSTPVMNFDLTKAFDPGWQPPDGWYFPMGDPYQARVLQRNREIIASST